MTASLYAAVALGAALGSVARFLVSLGFLQIAGAGLPWGTLVVNVAGSLAIGLYAALTSPGGRVAAGPVAQHFMLAGFCGGFTTFSVFSLESLLLVRDCGLRLAAAYVAISLVLWMGGVCLGHAIGIRLNEPSSER